MPRHGADIESVSAIVLTRYRGLEAYLVDSQCLILLLAFRNEKLGYQEANTTVSGFADRTTIHHNQLTRDVFLDRS